MEVHQSEQENTVETFRWLRSASIVISLVMVAGGSVNNGFTQFFFAIPFLLYYVIQGSKYGLRARACLSVALLIVSVPLFIDASKSRLFYPHIGAELSVLPGAIVTGYPEGPSIGPQSLIEIGSTGLHNFSSVELMTTLKLKVVGVKISHPDFAKSIDLVVMNDDGTQYIFYSGYLYDGIKNGWVLSDDILLNDKLQRTWTICLGSLMLWPLAILIPVTLIS